MWEEPTVDKEGLCKVVFQRQQGLFGLYPCIDELYQMDLISKEAKLAMLAKIGGLPIVSKAYRFTTDQRGAVQRVNWCREQARLLEEAP